MLQTVVLMFTLLGGSCDEKWFQCPGINEKRPFASSNGCIWREAICDGYDECGTDELHCNGMYILLSVFRPA